MALESSNSVYLESSAGFTTFHPEIFLNSYCVAISVKSIIFDDRRYWGELNFFGVIRNPLVRYYLTCQFCTVVSCQSNLAYKVFPATLNC